MALCLKENASSLDICALFVELWKEDDCSTIQWKANYKTFYVTSLPRIDKRLSLIKTAYYVASLEELTCLHFFVLLPPMLVQPADHRELCMLPRYDGAVHRSSSRLRHMFTDLIDSFLICRISD